MIHTFTLFDTNFVLDVNSGAIHVFDDISFDIVNLSGNEALLDDIENLALQKLSYEKSEILESLEEIKELVNRGELYSKEVTFSNLQQAVENIDAPIKSLCLNIAHDCNLVCEYCFASKGDFGKGKKLMDEETAKKCIDFLIKNSKNRHNLEVDFFGGEPLMNFNVVKKTVEYAKEQAKKHNKTIRFTITTNGMALNDDIIEFINDNMYNIVLSLDGRKNINDNARKTCFSNGSCYDTIVPKYQKLVKLRQNKNYYVRGTFTHHNLDFAEDVKHIKELGFTEISVEPVMLDPSDDYAIKKEDLPKVLQEYEKLALYVLECAKNDDNFNFFHFALNLNQSPCALKRLRGCGCAVEYVAVTPDGDIYPCHQFVGKDEYLLGNIDDEKLDSTIKERFAKSNVLSRESCKNCFAMYFCSGGCQANGYNFEGDIDKAHEISCIMEKKRIECAIALAYKLNELNLREQLTFSARETCS